ncbi:MFS transporter [Actinomycetospora sp. C-140]
MDTTGGLARYVRLARVPGVLPLGAASAVARLPLGMTGLALLLLVQARTGSYQQAGAAVGCFALASAVGSPARGRLADRLAPAPVLLVTGVAQPVALLGVVVATAPARPHTAPVLLAVVLAGLLVPPVGPVSRAVWQRLVTAPDLARAAFALDSLLLQLVFYVVAPPVVAVLATSAGPAVAVIAVAVLTVVGAVAVAGSPAVRSVPRRREPVHLLGPLTESRLLVVLLTSTVAAASFAALEVAVASAAVARGATGASGPLLALIGVGAIAGGLFYGTRSPAVSTAAQYRRWLVVLAAGTAPLVLATTTPVLGVLLVAAGVAIGPVSTTQFTLVGELAPAGTLTEAFTWLFSAALAGTALGSYLAGTVAQISGAQSALALPCALALALLGLAAAVRGGSP